jgi:hypothetical protein
LDAAARLDAAFGNGGQIRIGPFTDGLGEGIRVLLRDTAGNLYGVGQANDYTVGLVVLVVKLDASGRLVPSFGEGGVRLIPLGGEGSGSAASLDSHGDILVVGKEGRASQRLFALKLDSSGRLVETYGTGGRWVSDPCVDPRGPEVALDTNDNAYVVATCASNGVRGARVFKLDSTGMLVTGFGEMGTKANVFEDVPSRPSGAGAVLVDPSGNVYVAGTLGDCGDLAIAKLDAAGRVLGDFGAAGRAVFDLGGNDAAEKIALDGAGRLYVGARSTSCIPERPGLIPFVVVRVRS